MERYGNNFKAVNLDDILGPIITENIFRNKCFLLTCTIPIKTTNGSTSSSSSSTNERQVCVWAANVWSVDVIWLLFYFLKPQKSPLRTTTTMRTIYAIRIKPSRWCHFSRIIWSNRLKAPAVLFTIISKMYRKRNIALVVCWPHFPALPPSMCNVWPPI